MVPVLPLPWLQCIITTLALFSELLRRCTFEIGGGLLTDFKYCVECRGLVILPVPLLNLPVKFGVVVLPPTEIKDHEVLSVFLPDELLNLSEFICLHRQ